MDLKSAQPLSKEDINFRRELIVRDLDKTYDLASGLFKWVVATLLGLNGAALVTLVGSTELRSLVFQGPGWMFGLGALFSLGAGVAAVLMFAHLGEQIFDALWQGDNLDAKSFDEYLPNADNEKASRVGSVLLFASAICFIGGCVWTGVVAENTKQPVVNSPVGKGK